MDRMSRSFWDSAPNINLTTGCLMKKTSFLTFVLVIQAVAVWAAPFNTVSFPSETKSALTLGRSDARGFSAVNTLGHINLSRVDLGGEAFVAMEAPNCSAGSGERGAPLVPVVNRLIEVPRNATVAVVIHDIVEETVMLDEKAGGLKLAPRQPPRVKSRPAGAQGLVIADKAYARNSYGSEERVRVELLGDLRGVRAARLTVRPFRYNPAANTLKVATRLSFSVVFRNGDLRLTEKTRARYYSPAFQDTYDSMLNYPVSGGAKDALISGVRSWPLTYVVVASDDYLDSASLQAFIDWKRQLGFHVIEGDTRDIFYEGLISNPTTATKRQRLKDWLKSLYDEGEHVPSYVLFVGDVDQIPAFDMVNEYDALTTHATDLYYVTFSDNGYLPQAYTGRFPVDSQTDLDRMVAKTLAYEKYTAATGQHLGRAMAMAGGCDYAEANYVNGQVAYLLNEYLTAANGYSTIYAFLNGVSWTWPDVETGMSGPTLHTAAIMDRIDDGLGFANYTGHCDVDGWFNQILDDHELASTDIVSLDDNQKYGLYVGNCCESSGFDKNDAFGEKMVLAQNKGAVVYIGASYETYWDEDFVWAVGLMVDIGDLEDSAVKALSFGDTGSGNFDALWHSHGEAEAEWHVTAGQMVYRGNLAVEQVWAESAQYYFEVYNVLGDPSIMPFLRAPRTLDAPVVSGTITPCDTTSLTVGTAQHSRVALLKNGEPAAVKETGAGTSVTLTFMPFAIGDTAELVISSQNYAVQRTPVTVENVPGQAPSADFYLGSDPSATVVEVTAGVPVTFVNLSTGCPETRAWTFGGGTPGTSTDWSPTVVWNTLGYHDVSLVVQNSLGTDTLPRNNYVHVVPGINFSASPTSLKPGGTVTFTENCTHDPTAWQWTIRLNGSVTPYRTSTEQNPQIRFDNEGVYTVSLRVTFEVEDTVYYTLTRDRYILVQNPSSGSGGGGCFIGSLLN